MSNYKHISNNPTERSHINYLWAILDNVFDNKELEFIEKYMQKTPLSDPQYFDGKNLKYVSSENEETFRKSKVSFHRPDEKNNWIFEKINYAVEIANDRFFNFELNGYESIQYSEYSYEQSGKYDFHMDMHTSPTIEMSQLETRKLSFGMLLNEPGVDFEGGDFLINTSREKSAHKVDMIKGRLVFFPSFLLHSVTPVTKGIRKSLVCWVSGPKFR
jgi:PKHD-type hydroxylase